MERRRILLAIILAALGLALIAPAGATPAETAPQIPQSHRAAHAAAVAYWTAARIAAATPRELLVDPAGRRAGPVAKPDEGVNCNARKNRDHPDCQPPPDGGGEEPPPDEGVTGPVAPSTGAAWTGSSYDTATSDARLITGKVLFTLGATDYVCSGSVVDDGATGDTRALVLTAGHCVHEGSGGVWATNWTFLPDFDRHSDGNVRDCASSAYGCWVAQSLVTTSDWATDGNLNYDVGFAVMTQGGLSGTEPLEQMLAAQAAAPAAIGFNRTRGEYMTAFGYPHAYPYDGKRLIYCAGDAIPYHWWIEPLLLFSYHQGLACDMTGGSSGGPWYAEFDAGPGTGIANSVNSYKMSNDPNTIYGTYFGNYARKTYTEARTATGNRAVTPPNQLP